MTLLSCYLVCTAMFHVNMIISEKLLEYVRRAVSVRERPKLVEKINEINKLKKYSIIWPYAIHKIMKS